MFGRLREKIGQYYLNKKMSETRVHHDLVSLPSARKVGILYVLEDVPDYERVSQFVALLQQENKEVKALGFVRRKNLIERFLPKLSFDFFSLRDLSWFYQPVRGKVKEFIEKEFDLLIDLSISESFPLRYISGLSKAICRVGRFSEKHASCYDLMIAAKPAYNAEEYLQQVMHYLTIINSSETHQD
jgi:hypothetical protein